MQTRSAESSYLQCPSDKEAGDLPRQSDEQGNGQVVRIDDLVWGHDDVQPTVVVGSGIVQTCAER